MADTTPLDATAPIPKSGQRTLRRVITSTFRSRRNHGVFLVGGHVVGVYSRQHATAAGSVSVTAGHGQLMVDGAMTPDQARALARALHAAAGAAEASAQAGPPAALGAKPLPSIDAKLLEHHRQRLAERRATLGDQHPRTLAAEAQLRNWAGLVVDASEAHHG